MTEPPIDNRSPYRPATDSIFAGVALAPPPELRFHRQIDIGRFLRDLWLARGLLRTLAERDLRARYKQALLGAAWAFIGPVGFVVVFSVFFNHVAKVPTHGVPYVLFSYTALVPWGFFASAVVAGSTAVINNLVLVNKVPCPREVFPLAAILTAFVDTLVAAAVLPVLFVAAGRAPRLATLWCPLILVVQLAVTVGVTLLLAGLLVYVRDLRHGLPLLMQLLLFATPVGYGLESVPHRLVNLYSLLNPMAPIIDNYRRTMLYGQAPDWPRMALAGIHGLVMLVWGYVAFKRLEPGFADVA